METAQARDQSVTAILFFSLGATIAIEGVTFSLLARRWRLVEWGGIVLVNALTNPLVLYLHRAVLRDVSWRTGFVWLEASVIAIEAVLFALLFAYPARKALALSAACNAASAAAGLFL